MERKEVVVTKLTLTLAVLAAPLFFGPSPVAAEDLDLSGFDDSCPSDQCIIIVEEVPLEQLSEWIKTNYEINVPQERINEKNPQLPEGHIVEPGDLIRVAGYPPE